MLRLPIFSVIGLCLDEGSTGNAIEIKAKQKANRIQTAGFWGSSILLEWINY
jgi:hypothetical protein